MAKNYCSYLCTAAELEASYARCCSLGVPPELARLRKILPPARLASRPKANAALLSLVEQLISPVCCIGPQRHYIYILCDPELMALKIFAALEVLAATENTVSCSSPKRQVSFFCRFFESLFT
ncbi:hypothetical protein Adeg_1058 [Ammonifex degensii KC4]|uniref:Uncharacterized protein n=1 Tax=Ammonifex degensii (strain DSM 10501 / KC4) TaxID=429009 RepID=C9RD62_AMMDK|nr:hypothetical protein [Ammonifex degensii]ACX52189.1 hypothetical protein Adeg_1058 [Ammonifex degensii KC4]